MKKTNKEYNLKKISTLSAYVKYIQKQRFLDSPKYYQNNLMYI